MGWDDRPDDLTPAIDADFETHDFYARYARAMELVGNRHSKSALVNLVAFLLIKKEAGDG
jgi:hypothetical protein